MPNYPSLKEQDVGEPLDLTNLHFSIGQQFKESVSNAYNKQQFNSVVNNLSKMKPNPNEPATQPITDEDIKSITTERPGLNVPSGIPKFIGAMMASQYDDDKYLGLMSQAHPKDMGKVAAFGAWAANVSGSIIGGMANPKAMVTAMVGGGAGKTLFSSMASKAITKMGVREIYGSAAARVGTLRAESAGEGGGFGVGYQAAEEFQDQQKKGNLNEPHDYVQSLQNVGMAGLYGVGLGLGAGAVGIGLMGRRGVRMPDGTFAEREPLPGETKAREGGLLNRPEFTNMTDAVKEHITKIFKPWIPHFRGG